MSDDDLEQGGGAADAEPQPEPAQGNAGGGGKGGEGAGAGTAPTTGDTGSGDAAAREPSPFERADRSPLGGAGTTGGAGTARAARRSLGQGSTGDHRMAAGRDAYVHYGDRYDLLLGDRTQFVRGPVPAETLDHLDDVYCETAGYQRMKERLRSHRVLVLCGEPGSGRKTTALALLAEVTERRVIRLDPRHGVDEITADALHEKAGHLLEHRPEDVRAESGRRRARGERDEPARHAPVRLSELHLDRFADLLAGVDGYAVIVLGNGDLADRLLRGRYGMYCAPPPAADVLHRHLRLLLRGASGEAAAEARALAVRPDVVAALGLEELRPREAARLADHLAGHRRGTLTDQQLLAECASFVRGQAREWFAGADRPGTLPEALPLLNAAAFRIAVAVFDGSAYSIATEAAELLAWELAVTLDPEHPAGRRLFGTHAEHRPVLARSVLEDGELDLGPAKVPVRAVRFQGAALATAVLAEVWHGYHNVRGPVARWLRGLCDDPRPEVWVRASIAAGVLCSWDWIHGYHELVAPLAGTDDPVARMAAATALAEAARDPGVRPAVAATVKDWAASDDERLRNTALLTHGYEYAAGGLRGSLDALARVVREHDANDIDVLVAASFSVTRLLASGDPEPVLRRMRRWLADGRHSLANVVHVAVIRSLTTRTTYLWGLRDVPELDEHASRSLIVALLATRPDLAPALGALLRHTLNTARAGETALDGLGTLLRRAAKDATALGLVCGLLPLISVERRDRDRLRGLLNDLVRDRDRPLDKSAARRMWDAVAEGAQR
ncbi:ATP-binding protein [Streptomyces sp. NPDC048623]|uniref:ATP-binding protein n=1 Tax=Streptomyces sp. NPDC048623 TaxID=3155761 RepID=UPI003426D094